MLKVQSLIIRLVNEEASQGKICVKVRSYLDDLSILLKSLKKVNNVSHEAIQNSRLLSANKT